MFYDLVIFYQMVFYIFSNMNEGLHFGYNLFYFRVAWAFSGILLAISRLSEPFVKKVILEELCCFRCCGPKSIDRKQKNSKFIKQSIASLANQQMNIELVCLMLKGIIKLTEGATVYNENDTIF